MVNVIGLGYIGLPTALMMASHGVEVVGTNHNQGKIDMLKSGKTTFKGKWLDELFQAALAGGIQFTTEYQVADVYIVSVQTPYDEFTKKVEMVKHNEIKENMDKLVGKIVLDCHNVCSNISCYKL